ncbi:protein TMED8 [Rhinophrynus dorsalis]
MSVTEDAVSLPVAPSGVGESGNSQGGEEGVPECSDCQDKLGTPLSENGGSAEVKPGIANLPVEDSATDEGSRAERSPPISESGTKDDSSKCSSASPKKAAKEPTKSSLEEELNNLLSICDAESEAKDVLMIQSEDSGTVDIVKVESSQIDSEAEGRAPPPPLSPATTWTSVNLREFKNRMAGEKHGLLTVRRGEVLTIRVPTHPDGKRLCWEFATDDYDIGFGIYFDWTPVTSTAVTLQVSESSDEEDEEETESPWHSREGDVERGSVYRLRSRYGEIMPVLRRDSHREVQAGSHDYPGEGIYLLKLDNSYSLLRNKTLYFHVYYSS